VRFLSSLKERGKIEGEIKEIDHFSTEFSYNCAIVMSEKNEKHGISLLVYEEIEKIP
jgi:hypothetical protein